MLPTALFGWYLIVIGVSAERANETYRKENAFFNKQNDYNVTFERLVSDRYDHKYITFFNVYTYKYNRTTPVANGAIMYKVDVGNELEMITQVYRFASNEYRQFPLRFQMNFCKAVEMDIAGLGDFKKCGTFTGCPLLKGQNYSVCKWTPKSAKLPPFVPDGHYMVELQAIFRNVELFIMRAYVTIFRPIPIPEFR